MNFILLNVKYSPNLGDGIIAECFEHALLAAPNVTSVRSCDLAGRTLFDRSSNRFRQTIRAWLDRLPRPVARQLAIAILKRLVKTKLRTHYTRELDGADVAIIGGGQLIADAELNFPIKISESARVCRENGATLALHAVGVGTHFSRRGKALFESAFAGGLASIQVRDDRSAQRWAETFGGERVSQVWDPGLLSSEVYGTPDRQPRVRKTIGIGITQPATLNLHADNTPGLSKRDWMVFYVNLVRFCIDQGWNAELFTNGAFNDQLFAAQVMDRINRETSLNLHTSLAPSLNVPQELAHLIAGYDAIVAHRLHANIIAYSYGIPHVGLGWDSKMDGFFEATGRTKFLISTIDSAVVDHVGRVLSEALETPINAAEVARVRAEVSGQIRTLGEILSQSAEREADSAAIP